MAIHVSNPQTTVIARILRNGLITVNPVRSDEDLQATVMLFHSYAASLGFDLEFQSFDEEVSAMPGKYAPPTGELFLAKDGVGNPIGCAGLRRLHSSGPEVCEMKRLYVLPSGRGMGIGKALALLIIEAAERLGYEEMRLDTLPSMNAAVDMYRGLGFQTIPSYYDTPMEDTVFLSLKLPRIQESLAASSAS